MESFINVSPPTSRANSRGASRAGSPEVKPEVPKDANESRDPKDAGSVPAQPGSSSSPPQNGHTGVPQLALNSAVGELQTDNGPASALKTIQQMDLVPAVLEILDRVASGSLSAKDVYNEAGPLRAKLAKARAALSELDDTDKGIVDLRRWSLDLESRIARKRQLIRQFQQVMGAEADLEPPSQYEGLMDIDTDN
uniref:Mediator of RNA polymerase II transcription subunit 9 n=1 Tax=Blastobotrys adeninivorans TaxID=409370 RepID=A0A060TF06_BLAAD